MSSSHGKPPAGGRLQVHIPADLDPIYANLALITHSPSEIVLDFAQVMPQVPRANVKARLIMTPTNAKLLLRALNAHLAGYEAKHGEIEIPPNTSLADALFRSAGGDGDEPEEPKDD
jgi:hypothetical protein